MSHKGEYFARKFQHTWQATKRWNKRVYDLQPFGCKLKYFCKQLLNTNLDQIYYQMQNLIVCNGKMV